MLYSAAEPQFFSGIGNLGPISTTRFFNGNQSPLNTRFFTGNTALDAGIVGAAAGVATQYFSNQIFNPCSVVSGTRNNNQGTNNRIFGSQAVQNGALGFVAGYTGGKAFLTKYLFRNI